MSAYLFLHLVDDLQLSFRWFPLPFIDLSFVCFFFWLLNEFHFVTIYWLVCRDRNSALCHIQVSLTSCIGAGHIIFFAGIDWNWLDYCFDKYHLTGELLHFYGLSFPCRLPISSSYAVFPDGQFLLDACRGDLYLFICCKGLQHYRQNVSLSWLLLGWGMLKNGIGLKECTRQNILIVISLNRYE